MLRTLYRSIQRPLLTCNLSQLLGQAESDVATAINCKQISTTTSLNGGLKRFDREKDAVRQASETAGFTTVDLQPVSFDKLSSSFPTLETHNEHFNGIRFTDLPIIHIKSTRNNTILSVTDGPSGRVLAIQSAGTVGFRNAKKGTNVAAQAAAIALAGDVRRKDLKTVRVCLKGLGPGRLPALKALQMSGVNVVSITDTTALAFFGNRPKKVRKL